MYVSNIWFSKSQNYIVLNFCTNQLITKGSGEHMCFDYYVFNCRYVQTHKSPTVFNMSTFTSIRQKASHDLGLRSGRSLTLKSA